LTTLEFTSFELYVERLYTFSSNSTSRCGKFNEAAIFSACSPRLDMRITWVRLLRLNQDLGALLGIAHASAQLRHLGLQLSGGRFLRALAAAPAQIHDAHLVVQTKKEEQAQHAIHPDQQKGSNRNEIAFQHNRCQYNVRRRSCRLITCLMRMP